MGGALVPIATTAGGALLQHFLNGQGQTNTATPPELAGPRSSQINLLQSLLGPNQGNPGQNLQNFFGPLGMPQSDLQRQSAGGLSQFLEAGSPAMKAINTTFPALQGMLTGTGPQFERDIAAANQQGQRFGSGNEILRGEALRNLFNMRNQTAQTIGMLGQEQAGLFGQGFGVGTQQAQQADMQTQRILSLLGGLLGLRQQMVAGLPITRQPSQGQQFGQFAQGLASILPFLLHSGGQTGNLVSGGTFGVDTVTPGVTG